MEIKSIKTLHDLETEEVTGFYVTYKNYGAVTVPADPGNRHYWEVKDWYDAQESKPFEYAFEEMPEPVFAETIYPEVEEVELGDEVAEVSVPEVPQVPDEPETLMPRRG